MTVELLPISVTIPTRNRCGSLSRMLESLAKQAAQPYELIIIDGSSDDETQQLVQSKIPGLETRIMYQRAEILGAAAQRNQAIALTSQDTIGFMDDDIIFEPNCLKRLWLALQSDERIGGVNAMITNQKYLPPGRISRHLFQFLHGQSEQSYAGKCIGPGLNLLPEDNPDLPEVMPMDWLNTTCVLYRRAALPTPLFPLFFTGYSLMEDLTLSLKVGKRWKLANARTARIFHDSQSGDHKNRASVLAKMELVNRHFVMTQMLERSKISDYFRLTILQLFFVIASLTSLKGWLQLPQVVMGKVQGIAEIVKQTDLSIQLHEWN